jgi:anti-sigma regulatory factor (Ser/Thr protein kinase)
LNNKKFKFQSKSRQKSIVELKGRLSTIVKSLLSTDTSRILLLAIDELVQNAYEHGNLELSSDLKNRLIANNTFVEELYNREKEHGEKEISVEIDLSNQLACITVSDQGKGFEWRSLFEKLEDSNSINKELATSGNGLALLKKLADEFYYEDQGRTSIFKKRLTLKDF